METLELTAQTNDENLAAPQASGDGAAALLEHVTDRRGQGAIASDPGKILTKDRYNPYAPIRKDASKTSAGNITGYGIELEVAGENGMEWDLVGTVSPEYLLIPNADIKRIGDDICRESGLDWKEDRVIFNGSQFVRTMVVENTNFRQAMKPGSHTKPEDDVFRFGLLQRNSYNGSTAASIQLYIERLVCVNGLVSTSYFASHRFRHTIGNDNWEEEMEKALSIIKYAPETLEDFIISMETLRSQKMTDDLLRTVRTGLVPQLPVTKWGEVMDRYLTEEEDTLYGFLNAATNVLWHKESATVSNLSHNDHVVTSLLDWAHSHRN